RYSNDIGEWTVRNPDAISASGSRKINIYDVRPQIYADIKLTKDLTWYTKGAIGFMNEFNKRHEYPVDNYYFDDGSYAHNNAIINLGVQDLMVQRLETTLFSTLQYRKEFNESHSLGVLAGY